MWNENIYVRDGFYLLEEVKEYLNPPSTDCLNSIEILDHKILKKTFPSGDFKIIEFQTVKIHSVSFLKSILDIYFEGKRKTEKMYENNIVIFRLKKESEKKSSSSSTTQTPDKKKKSSFSLSILCVCKEDKKKKLSFLQKVNKLCREKAGYLLDDPIKLEDPTKYFYIEPRKFYNVRHSVDDNKNTDIDEGSYEFIKTISSLDAVISYIQKNDLKDDFLFHKFPIEKIQKLRLILDRLSLIINNPKLNKKYVIENETDPLFRELLFFQNAEYSSKSLITDEKEELSLIFYSLSPYKEKGILIETEEQISHLHVFLDEVENIEKNFFVKSTVSFRVFYEGSRILKISSVDRTEGKVLYDYVHNSWGYNHHHRPTIKNILEIHYNNQRFNVLTPDIPFSKSNRFYLFHGSPLVNWKSIILNGLQLPTYSGMFGKGIYFASSIGKSFGYVYDKTGIQGTVPIRKNYAIGIFEVNLGNMKKLKTAEPNIDRKTLEKHFNSVWGLGSNSFEKTIECEGGIKIPIVETNNRKDSSLSLIHDEFIIYESKFAVLKYVVFLEDKN